jgi:putative oxidoreductase
VPVLAKLTPFTLGLLRIFAAFIFFQFGAQKVLGLFGDKPAEVFSLVWFGGVVELIGSIALAVGWFTRPIALLLALDMAAIYSVQHLSEGVLPIAANRVAEEIFLLLLIAALLVFAGPEKFSVEGALTKARGHRLARYYPDALAIFRILIGAAFMSHGLEKLFGIGGEPQEFLTLRWFAGVLEFLGGAGVGLGLLTGPVAFIVCGEMAVAYFMNHNSRGFWPVENNGIRAVLYCYIFMFLVTAGPGKFSLDDVLWKKNHAVSPEIRGQ